MNQKHLFFCGLGLLLVHSGCFYGCAPEAAAFDGASKEETARTTMIEQNGCLRAAGQPDSPCVANPQGCASINVETDPATGESCEVCYGVGGNVIERHCGEAQTAACSRLEDQLGNMCTICTALDGTTIYDSCHQQTRAAARCEPYLDADNQQCQICYDEFGAVVSRDCASTEYSCQEVVAGDQICKRCTDQSGQVTETCSGAGGDPTSCSVIEDATGYRCYTCTNAEGVIVDHNCSSPTPVYCESYYSSDNTLCETCYDESGGIASQYCETAPVEESCREYRSESSICMICFDANNNITRRDCYVPCSGNATDQRCQADDECTGGTACINGVCACPPAPACELFTTENGMLCEICGDLNQDGLVNELDANCFDTPTDPVRCWEEQRQDGSGEIITCQICESATGGRTEECSQNLAPGLTCEVVQTTGSQTCEVCRDSSGAVVHSSCADLVCSEATVEPIRSDTTNSDLVACQICNRGDQLASMACDMGAVCAQTSGVAPPDPNTSSVDGCGNTWVSIEPLQCASSPWQLWWQELYPNEQQPLPTREGELIRAYYAATQQPPIQILAYRIEHAFDAAVCTSCDCPRGDLIYLYVTAADAERLLRLGWRQV